MSVISQLFVYGTLQPGDARWPILAPYVADSGVVDRVAGRVPGEPLRLEIDPVEAELGVAAEQPLGARAVVRAELLDEALAVLDDEESSVPGGYRRVVVTTDAGTKAWAYEFGGGLELTAIESGDWLRR